MSPAPPFLAFDNPLFPAFPFPLSSHCLLFVSLLSCSPSPRVPPPPVSSPSVPAPPCVATTPRASHTWRFHTRHACVCLECAQVYHAFVLAHLLNRTLVLPRVKCWCIQVRSCEERV
eukprot:361168-Chlamydomonas_euryale.AAC.6